MEPVSMFVYSAMALLSLAADARSDPTVQHCSYINIHVVKEDGQPQILTIADPDSDMSCGCQPPRQGTLDSQCQSPSEPSRPLPVSRRPLGDDDDSPTTRKLFQPTGPDGLPYPAHRIPVPPFQHGARYWGLAPTVSIIIEDVMSKLCGDRRNQPTICNIFSQVSVNCPPDSSDNKDYIEQCANYIVENDLLPVPTGESSADNRIAYGHVLIGAKLVDEAIEYFTSLIKEYPNLASAYHGRGMAYAKKGLVTRLAERALVDFMKASELEPLNPEHYQCMAELYIPLGKYHEAMNSVKKAAALMPQPTSRILFLKATLELASENFKIAELDYRESLKRSKEPQMIYLYYNLAVTLYYRGKLRNSIETYKELLKIEPNHTEAHCGLAHAYSKLGDNIHARREFNETVHLNSDHLLTRQLKGLFHYNSGQLQKALNEFQICLRLEPENYVCQFMESLSLTSLGRFYKAIKGFTKIIVNRKPAIKMSPEFIKSQYLREYGRFLHQNLDEDLLNIDFDGLHNEFKNKWIKLEPFTFKTPYTEQPGLSPRISDVSPSDFREWPIEIREIVCLARTLGTMMSSSTDGQLKNERKELAMGLASIHIAQAMRDVWEDVGASKTDRTVTWRQVFDIAVRYIRLVNPEEPVFWLDKMNDRDLNIGYTHDMYIVKGHTINVKMMHYFDLVYRLVRTMISVHCGEGEMYPEIIMHELASAETYEELIEVFHKDIFRDQGFVMSTQLSSMKNPDGPKHEGVMLSIAADKNGKMALSVNLPFNKEKATAVYQEMDYVFFELYNEIKKFRGRTAEDPDHIINLILSLVYYFLNLSPISHGSSAVAWSVAVGLIMSVGRDVTGKIGPGKLLEIEAALTGGPDVFSAVTKTWMKIKRMKDNPLLRFEHVSTVLPTLRDVLEALSHAQSDCYEVFAISKNIMG